MMIWQWVIKAGTPFRTSKDKTHNDVKTTLNHRGIAYGDGFFTTMGVRGGKVLWQKQHAYRVLSHAKALQLWLPNDAISHLWSMVARQAAQIGEGMLKLIVTRQTQSLRGYAFSTSLQDNACDVWLGIVQNESDSNPISNNITTIAIQPPITAICLDAKLACLPSALVGLKTLNRLDSVLAAGELENHKKTLSHERVYQTYAIGEGLVSDVSGQWVEGVMSNVFYQLSDGKAKNETWYTPPIDKSGVSGVMRQVIINKVKRAGEGSVVVERRLLDADLASIKAMFFCNAVRGVIPVAQLLLPCESSILRTLLGLSLSTPCFVQNSFS